MISEERDQDTINQELAQAEIQTASLDQWRAFSFYVMAGTVFLLYAVAPLYAYLHSIQAPTSPAEEIVLEESAMLLSLLASQVPVIIVLFILSFLFFLEIPISRKFSFVTWRWSYIPLAMGIEFLLLPAVYIVTVAFSEAVTYFFNVELPPRDLQVFLLDCSTQTLVLMAFGAVIVAPIIEELMFRKCIFDYLSKALATFFKAILTETSPSAANQIFCERSGLIVSTLATSALFSAVHYTLIQSPALFIIGLTLQILYICFRSIYPCIILHIVHNGTAFGFLIIIRIFKDHPLFQSLI